MGWGVVYILLLSILAKLNCLCSIQLAFCFPMSLTVSCFAAVSCGDIPVSLKWVIFYHFKKHTAYFGRWCAHAVCLVFSSMAVSSFVPFCGCCMSFVLLCLWVRCTAVYVLRTCFQSASGLSLGAATIVTLVILLILCSTCVSLCHWILGLLLLKGRMWDL